MRDPLALAMRAECAGGSKEPGAQEGMQGGTGGLFAGGIFGLCSPQLCAKGSNFLL